MDIHIDSEQLKLFFAIVIAGAVYGQWLYRKGLRHGWDQSIYSLEDAGFLQVDEEGEVKRVSDRQYKEYKRSEFQYNGD
jgi:hypothetical protein